MMEKLTLLNISLAALKRLVELRERGIRAYEWTQVEAFPLTENEQRRLEELQALLKADPVHLLNEATIWARAIYPLLQLAEQDDIRALAGVALQVAFAQFEIEGIADGAIGKSIAGRMEVPYLVMVETKRGVEGQNPIFQLYGQLLAAARLNWESDHLDPQEIFGCYTIADSWTFVRAEVAQLDSDRPRLQAEYSREYTEKFDAETILKLLKAIIARHNDCARSVDC
jgi:hypothetical protein